MPLPAGCTTKARACPIQERAARKTRLRRGMKTGFVTVGSCTAPSKGKEGQLDPVRCESTKKCDVSTRRRPRRSRRPPRNPDFVGAWLAGASGRWRRWAAVGLAQGRAGGGSPEDPCQEARVARTCSKRPPRFGCRASSVPARVPCRVFRSRYPPISWRVWRTPSSRSRRSPPADFIPPAQPTLATRPPAAPEWLYEVKHDG